MDVAEADLVARLREGYDAWLGNGCDAASACHQFRGELRALLADLREGARFAQVVACAEAPGLPIRPLETGLIEQLVVDESGQKCVECSHKVDQHTPAPPPRH